MNRSSRRVFPAWQSILFALTVAVLAISGLAQMPISRRYYIADVPGLGWTADFYFTHLMHYVAAAVLLFLVFSSAAAYLTDVRLNRRLSLTGIVRIAIYAGIIITGFIRVLKNLPDISFSPTATMLVDWVHLGLAPFLGIFSLIAFMTGHSRYIEAGADPAVQEARPRQFPKHPDSLPE